MKKPRKPQVDRATRDNLGTVLFFVAVICLVVRAIAALGVL